MIIFILFKMLSWMYEFNKSTVDVYSPIFALFSAVEFIAVVGFAVTNFRDIVTFIKELKK